MYPFSSGRLYPYKQWGSILFAALLFTALTLSPTTLYAQGENPNPLSCYGVGDEWLSADGTENGALDPGGSEVDYDYLAVVDRLTGVATPLGATGTRGIEAIAFVPSTVGPIFNILYAVANEDNLDNATSNTLGTLDLGTGAWTPISAGTFIGSGTGADGTEFTFTDIDGLTYDVQRKILWATQRNGLTGAPDYLLQIDPETGLLVADGFGAGIDWVEIEVATDPLFVTPAGEPYDDVDDLAVDPVTGRMFIIMNNGGEGGGLVEINPADGSVISYVGLFTTDVATSPDSIADDMEGLAFFNDGRLYGSSGNNGPQPGDSDRIYQIDFDTGEALLIDAFPPGVQDIESLGCLTAPAFIDLEKATNGEDADEMPGPTIQVGSEVTWTYVISNTGFAPLINLTLTDDILGDISDSCAEGALPNPLNPGISFACTVTGIAETEGQYANIGTVEAVYEAPVLNDVIEVPLTATDPSHYVGTVEQLPGISIVKTAGDAADGEVYTISEAGLVIFNYNVTNSGNTHLVDISITDDAGTPTDTSDDVVIDSAVCADLAGPLAPQGVVTCNAEIQVDGDATNVAQTIGTPSDDSGTPLPNLDPPTDQDDAIVTLQDAPNLVPSITLQKTVYEGQNNGTGCPGIELVESATGTLITYCFEVTNNGTTHQNDVTVTDTDLGITLTSPDLLAPGASVMLYHETTLDAALLNTAEATGVPSDENGISIPNLTNPPATDTAEVTPLAQLGNIVWLDQNADGVQDGDELGLAGVEVTLFNEEGDVVGSQLTDSDGNYLFFVQPGTYSLGFDTSTLGEGYYISPQDSASDDVMDSDASEQDGRTIITSLVVGEADLDWDAGVFAPPILTVTKSDNNAQVQPGGRIEYTINYSNTGSSDAIGVIISESIPQYTTFAPELSTDGWRCNGNATTAGTNCIFEIGTVEKGTTGTLDLTFTVIADEEIPESVTVINNVIQISDDGSRGTPPAAARIVELSTLITRPLSLDQSKEPGAINLYVPMMIMR